MGTSDLFSMHRHCQNLKNNEKFLANQRQWITTDLIECKKFEAGLNNLSEQNYKDILKLNLDYWKISKPTKRKRYKNTILNPKNKKEFKSQLIEWIGISQDSLFLLSNALMNNNLYLILHKMHRFGFLSEEILEFKEIIIQLYYPEMAGDLLKKFYDSILNKDISLLQKFLQKGFRPNWLTSPLLGPGLTVAVISKSPIIVEMILDCPKINHSATDVYGYNPLMRSIIEQDQKIIEILLRKKGFWDVNHQNILGQTIFDLAKKHIPTKIHLLTDHLEN